MENNLIDELNKVLTNTLDYKEVLHKFGDTVSHQVTQDKLNEFSKVADKESKTLIQLITSSGGDVETTERHTDHESLRWVSRPLPEPKNIEAVLACLIEAERNKEQAYNRVLSHKDITREHKNSLDKHRREAESNLKYFQTAKGALNRKDVTADKNAR